MATIPSLTIVSLPNARWVQAVTSTNRVQSAGSCNHYITVPLDALKHWFDGNANDPELRRLGFFIEATRKAKGRKHDPLPELFEKGLEVWKEKGMLDELKKALPAFVPSVRFHPHSTSIKRKEGGGYYSNKAMVSRNPSFWSHTGILGIDIDLGHLSNPDAPDLLWEKALALPHIPGFLFMYASPSGGVKAFFTLSPALTDALNDFPIEHSEATVLASRISLHKLCYFTLAQHIQKFAGLTVDPVCHDPARLQFMYRTKVGRHVFRTSETFFEIPDLDKARDAMETNVRTLRDSSLLLTPLATNELPENVLKFASWLRGNGFEAEADGLRAMRPEGYHWYGFCPCCKDKCTGVRADRDLRMTINAEDPTDVRFYCFHSTCSDLRKLKTPMWRLWQMYIDDIESENSQLPDIDMSSDVVAALLRAGLADQEFYKRKGQFRNKVLLNKFNVARVSKLRFPDVKMNKDGEISAVLVTARNFDLFLKHGYQLHPVYNTAIDSPVLLDLKSGDFTELQSNWTHVFLRDWEQISPLPLAVDKSYSYITSAALRDRVHPLLALAASKEWDGEDRLSTYLSYLPVNSLYTYDRFTPEQWRDRVLTTWLVCIYLRLKRQWYNNFVGMGQNNCPILAGGQGIGKNTWIEFLFSTCRDCFSNQAVIGSETSKDLLGTMISTSCIHIDEIDHYTSNYKLCAELKSLITKASVKFRKPYERKDGLYTVISSWIGSTNKDKFLVDETGNRRFYVVYLDECRGTFGYENVDRIKSMDTQQIWAQIKYLADSGQVTEKSWADLHSTTTQNNDMNAMEASIDEYLITKLRPVRPHDTDIEGFNLSKHIPLTYTDFTLILQELREEAGRTDKVTPMERNRFKTSVVTTFKNEWGANTSPFTRVKRNSKQFSLYRVLKVTDWLSLASQATKNDWYATHPDDLEADKALNAPFI